MSTKRIVFELTPVQALVAYRALSNEANHIFDVVSKGALGITDEKNAMRERSACIDLSSQLFDFIKNGDRKP